MDVKGTVDFSSYILFEATGDSEADYYDPNIGGYADEIARVGDYHDDDDDDALSCSYDRSDICNAAEANWGGESCDASDDADDDEHDGDALKKEGEEKNVYGTSYCEDDEILQEHHKSFVSFDSNQKSLDEMEKNRLFWEACLAS